MSDISGLKLFLEAAGRFVEEGQMKRKGKYKLMKNVLLTSKNKYKIIMEEVMELKKIHGEDHIWNFIFKNIDVTIHCKKKIETSRAFLSNSKKIEPGVLKSPFFKRNITNDKLMNTPSIHPSVPYIGELNQKEKTGKERKLTINTLNIKDNIEESREEKNENVIRIGIKEENEEKETIEKIKEVKQTDHNLNPNEHKVACGIIENEIDSLNDDDDVDINTEQICNCPHYNENLLHKKMKTPELNSCFNNFLTFALETSMHKYLVEKGYRLIACPYLDFDRDWFYYEFDQICYYFIPDFVLNALALFKKCFNTFNNLTVCCIFLEVSFGIVPITYVFKTSFALNKAPHGISCTKLTVPHFNRIINSFSQDDTDLLENEETYENSEEVIGESFTYKITQEDVLYTLPNPFDKTNMEEEKSQKNANILEEEEEEEEEKEKEKEKKNIIHNENINSFTSLVAINDTKDKYTSLENCSNGDINVKLHMKNSNICETINKSKLLSTKASFKKGNCKELDEQTQNPLIAVKDEKVIASKNENIKSNEVDKNILVVKTVDSTHVKNKKRKASIVKDENKEYLEEFKLLKKKVKQEVE